MQLSYRISVVAFLFLPSLVLAQMDRRSVTDEYAASMAPPRPATIPEAGDVYLEGMSSDPFLDDLTPGYVIIDGDIQVPFEQLEAHLDGLRAVFGDVTYWNGTVPYDFAGNVSMLQQQAAIDAMDEIEMRAGVVFRPKIGSDSDWVRFQNSTFNNSPVGRRGGMQIINIFNWNFQIIIVHELYHSLGYWHEQSAADRNTFVTINYGNVCGSSDTPGNQCHPATCRGCSDGMGGFISCAFNFDIVSGASLWGPYDFDSFMHYGQFAFSCNGNPTISVNPPWNTQWQNAIGQRDHFSLIDELSCRGIYPFAGDRWLRSGAGGANTGTFFNPFNGTFTAAVNGTPENGTLLIDPGTYSGVGTYSEAKTIRGTYGAVTIGD